jgi:hypothetical protein
MEESLSQDHAAPGGHGQQPAGSLEVSIPQQEGHGPPAGNPGQQLQQTWLWEPT